MGVAHSFCYILLIAFKPLLYTIVIYHWRAPHWVTGREQTMAYTSDNNLQESNLALLLKSGHHVPTGALLSCCHLFSRGRKSKFLFKSGKRRAEALMTSVGFGVTRPRTCCFRQTITLQYKQQTITLQNKSTFWVMVPMASNCPEQKQDVHIFLQSCAHLSCPTGNMFTSQ